MQHAHTDNTQLSDRGVCSSQRSRRKTGEASRRRRAPACPGPSEQPQRSSSGRALVTSKRAARRSGAWTSETQARPGENPPGPRAWPSASPSARAAAGAPGGSRASSVSAGLIGRAPPVACPPRGPPSQHHQLRGSGFQRVCVFWGDTHVRITVSVQEAGKGEERKPKATRRKNVTGRAEIVRLGNSPAEGVGGAKG